MEVKLDEFDFESKTINIEKRRDFNDFHYSEYFSKEWNVRAYISYLEFSEPIIDFKGNEQNKLSLKTIWFLPENPYWMIWLNDERAFQFGESKSFGNLNESFWNYSKQKLEDWQKQALDMHSLGLRKLENLFYKGEKLQKNFLEHL